MDDQLATEEEGSAVIRYYCTLKKSINNNNNLTIQPKNVIRFQKQNNLSSLKNGDFFLFFT